MNAVAVLFAQALLVVTVISARPADATVIRTRLLLQAALLCVCLLVRLAGGGGGPCLVCSASMLCEIGLLVRQGGYWRDPVDPPSDAASAPAPSSRWAAMWPIGACVLLSWLAFRLLPAAPLARVALAIVLCGAVSALASRDSGAGDRSGWASLLQSGHGVLLFVGAVPGPGWPGLLLALPLQGVVLGVLCRRAVWSDAPEPVRQ